MLKYPEELQIDTGEWEKDSKIPYWCLHMCQLNFLKMFVELWHLSIMENTETYSKQIFLMNIIFF